MVKRAHFLIDYIDLLMMGMCRTFAQMFKLAGLMFSLKAFRLNSLSP